MTIEERIKEIKAQHAYGIESENESMIHRRLYVEDTKYLISELESALACKRVAMEALKRTAAQWEHYYYKLRVETIPTEREILSHYMQGVLSLKIIHDEALTEIKRLEGE